MAIVLDISRATHILQSVNVEKHDGSMRDTPLVEFNLSRSTSNQVIIELADIIANCVVSNGFDLNEQNLKQIYVTHRHCDDVFGTKQIDGVVQMHHNIYSVSFIDRRIISFEYKR